jgi:hypothetical protein
MRNLMLAMVLGIMTAGTGRAASITYTGATTASGSLGSNSFSNAAITFAFAGDTANVSAGTFIDRINVGAATVQVAGLGTAAFSGVTEVLVNRGANLVDFVDDTDGTTLFLIQNAAFAGYHLTDPIGPLSGVTSSTLNQPSGTIRGNLVLTAISGTGTFQAVLGVPEPSSVGLLGLGLSALAGPAWHRRLTARGPANLAPGLPPSYLPDRA